MKKKLIQKPQTNPLYKAIVTRPESTKQCLIEDVHNNYFLFNTPQECHIVAAGIHKSWPNFDTFANMPKQDILARHANAFRAEPPKDQDLVVTALMTWYALVNTAADRTIKAPKDPVSGKRSEISTRKYVPGSLKLKDNEIAATIKTPQAITCYRIFLETLGEKPHVTEAELKTAIVARATEVKTRQDPWRIFQYYRPELIKKNLIKSID